MSDDDKLEYEVEVSGRTDPRIAEAAEALSTDTDLIMGVSQFDGEVTVLYTPDLNKGDNTVWQSKLTRGTDGILILIESIARPEWWEKNR
jgi:hypothetical protein